MNDSQPANRVPEGTETDAWKVMSAAVARAIWLGQRAAEPPTDGLSDADAWAAQATDFRVLVRFALRALEREGIRLRSGTEEEGFDLASEEWRVYSARAAWLLWLRARRSRLPVNETIEAETWAYVAAEQRRIIRGVLTKLAEQGIRFLK